MDTRDGSDECQRLVNLTLGYIQSLIDESQTDEAREMALDWKHLINSYAQKDGDE